MLLLLPIETLIEQKDWKKLASKPMLPNHIIIKYADELLPNGLIAQQRGIEASVLDVLLEKCKNDSSQMLFISGYQTLSEAQVEKYCFELALEYVFDHKRYRAEFIDRILNKVGEKNKIRYIADAILAKRKMPEWFVAKYQ